MTEGHSQGSNPDRRFQSLGAPLPPQNYGSRPGDTFPSTRPFAGHCHVLAQLSLRTKAQEGPHFRDQEMVTLRSQAVRTQRRWQGPDPGLLPAPEGQVT